MRQVIFWVRVGVRAAPHTYHSPLNQLTVPESGCGPPRGWSGVLRCIPRVRLRVRGVSGASGAATVAAGRLRGSECVPTCTVESPDFRPENGCFTLAIH